MFFANINYIVVIIATVIGVVISSAWYSPWLFGKAWLKAKGWNGEASEGKKIGRSMVPSFATITAATFVEAFVIAALLNSLITLGVGSILLVVILLWAGFVVPTKLGDYFFGGEAFVVFLISVGYGLLSITIMSLIIAFFS